MAKQVDSTNIVGLLQEVFTKVKNAFWAKGDTSQLSIDNAPTRGSTNLVKSGGVFSDIHPAIASSMPSGGFLPNIIYNLGTITDEDFELATPSDNTIANHYFWTFETGATPPTVTWPTGITWIDGSAPTINASKHYEISVLNGYGTYMEV